MLAVKMSNVSKIFQSHTGEVVHALKAIDLEVGTGEFLSIVGPSGSGKSTLMSIIGCLDVQSSGGLEIFGDLIYPKEKHKRSRVRRDVLSFMFQSHNLNTNSSVSENIQKPLAFKGVRRKERKRRCTTVLEELGLLHLKGRKTSELSGGQQQRIALARAIALRPRLLIADEPTAALDHSNAELVIDLIKQLNFQGVTIIMGTHDQSLLSYSDRTISLKDGKIE